MNDVLGGLDMAAVRQTMLDAAEVAATHTLPRFRTTLAVETKGSAGFDPVTEADKAAETAIRALIGERFPTHGIVGEEWGDKSSDGPFNWIIDPIDGTRAFISGAPVWGTLIGLMYQGRAVAGLMAQPFTGEIYLSLPGSSTYHRQGEALPLRTSNVTELARAKLSATSPELFTDVAVRARWAALHPKVLLTRYGLDCYAYCLLAAGHFDLVVEAGLKDVDIAPLIPIIENAGGVVTTWAGEPGEKGGNIVAAATKELHAATLAALRG